MIIELLQGILADHKEISRYTITSVKSHSDEMFLIKRSIDMVRAKDVEHISLTLYKNYRGKLSGSTTVSIHPTMTKEDIEAKINEGVYATQFAKNPYFPLPKKKAFKKLEVESNIKDLDPVKALKEIAEAVFAGDNVSGGYINSTEIFLNKNQIRILNSNGVDYTYDIYRGEIEFITTYSGKKEEIELYNFNTFANVDEKKIKERIKKALVEAKDRAKAKPMPDLGSFDVVVKDESVKEVLESLITLTSAGSVYLKQTPYKVGDKLQKEPQGDLITMSLVPYVAESTTSRPADANGVVLKKHMIIKDGEILKNHGDISFSYYLGIPATGNLPNVVYAVGKESIKTYKSKPYVEVISFSALDVDVFTGSFGGEVRLAYYYDGKRKVPVYGGTVMGNLYKNFNDLHLSKEELKMEGYRGPKYLVSKMIVAK